MQKITKYLCRIIKQAAKMTDQSFKVYSKDEFGDIVTDIDKKIESFLIDKLERKYPEYDIVSEEFTPNRAVSSHCFVIDPIDGTGNFAGGIPLWGIQIAAIENGDVVSSVIYLPKINEFYYADCDGAYLNDTRLEITPEIKYTKQVFAISGNSLPVIFQKGSQISHRNFRCINSASVAYAWVAAGRLNGYCLCSDKKWDYIPGMYLVQIAGGFTKDEPCHHAAATNREMLDYFDELLSESPAQK